MKGVEKSNVRLATRREGNDFRKEREREKRIQIVIFTLLQSEKNWSLAYVISSDRAKTVIREAPVLRRVYTVFQ